MIMNLDIDELTLLEMFEGGTREDCLDSLREALGDFDGDREMQDILRILIDKVGEMTDREYTELDYTEAVTGMDPGSESAGGSYDEYGDQDDSVFIEVEEPLGPAADFMIFEPDYDGLPEGMRM